MTFDDLITEILGHHFTKQQAERLVSAVVMRIEESLQNGITFLPEDACKLCGKSENKHHSSSKYCYISSDPCPEGPGTREDYGRYNLRYIGPLPATVLTAMNYEPV